MSRFKNVTTLLETAEEYNQEKHVELLLDEDTPTEDLAEDLAFVLISMWSMVPDTRKLSFMERLTNEIVDVELKGMSVEVLTKDPSCRNCSGAMWWVPEEGWYHAHPHCVDPDPFLGEE